MNLTVNEKSHEHAGDGTVASLLAELGATPEHTALTVNGKLVSSREWSRFILRGGDCVELLTFVGGG